MILVNHGYIKKVLLETINLFYDQNFRFPIQQKIKHSSFARMK
jgi:hypothetical protein